MTLLSESTNSGPKYNDTIDSFEAMYLKTELLRGIYAYGLERPSAFQQRAIMPLIKDNNVIAQTQSGTEKIAAFSIAVLQNIDPNIKSCQALILARSRVLVQQIEEVVIAIGNLMDIKCHACFGGHLIEDDTKALEEGPHLVIGTPGRTLDMIQRGALRTDNTKMFVLDETDELLAIGFTESIYEIFPLLPLSVQIVVLSATMSHDVLELTTKFMRDPIRILDQKDEVEDR
ncbi:ATP-dependent RNA helicase eIF4A [Aureobasidium sp. EXF-8845]|nr:ATP-dependent RNA helicase eIF4A [Aureobasidium sp. EXF-8845]KAI4858212.1 ATP-dependent RNA helicase eIF4A [Aureobasidium sp. EXF-8846]